MGTVDRRARAPAVPEVKVLRTLGSGPFRREPNAAQYCSKPAAGSRATSTSLGLAEPYNRDWRSCSPDPCTFLSGRRSVASRSGECGTLGGYISPVETLRMLPSGSLNQTAFSESPIEATPSFHSTPSISKV